MDKARTDLSVLETVITGIATDLLPAALRRLEAQTLLRTIRPLALTAFSLLVWLAAAVPATAQSSQEEIELLKEQIRLLEARLERLERQSPGSEINGGPVQATWTLASEASDNNGSSTPQSSTTLAAANPPSTAAAASPDPQQGPAGGRVLPADFKGYDGGFRVVTGDERFSLRVNGFTQARFTSSIPDAGVTNNNFDLALGRLSFSGNAFDPKVSYFLQYEASTFGNTNGVTMLDWWLGYQLAKPLQFQMGRFILPYSRQFYTHPGELLFGDLSEADYAFNLQRAVGANVSGKSGRVSYHLVATNSIRALDAGGQQNFGGAMATQGRFEIDLLEPYGYLETSPETPAAPQLSIGLAAAYNPIDQASTFQNVMPGDTTRNLTVDMGFRVGRISLQAAGYYRRNKFANSLLGSGDDWGYYGQIGYYLVPRQWELAARVSGVDFARLNNPNVLGDVTEFTLGVNRYLHGHHVKVNTDYSLLRRSPFESENRYDHRIRLQFQILM